MEWIESIQTIHLRIVVKRLMSHILMALVKKNTTKVGFDTMEVFFVFFFAVFRMKSFLKITTYIILEHWFRFRAFSQILRNHLCKGSYETFATRLMIHIILLHWSPLNFIGLLRAFHTTWWYSWEFLLSNFQIVACVLINKFYADKKKNSSLENITWSVMEKQTVQAKEGYCQERDKDIVLPCLVHCSKMP